MSKCIELKYLDVENQCPKGMCYIYVLIDPVSEKIRYVGKTIGKLSVRYASHCCIAGARSKLNYRSINWIKSLKNKNLRPIIKVIDVVPIVDWVFWEIYYIDYFKSNKFDLTNTFSGGQPGNSFPSKWTEETRKNQRNAIINRKLGINLIDLNGNIIFENSNFSKIAEFLNRKIENIYSSYKSKSLINKRYFIVKLVDMNDFVSKINLKRKQTMILVENTLNGNKSIFSSSADAALFIGACRASISIALNQNKIIKNNKITRYYE